MLLAMRVKIVDKDGHIPGEDANVSAIPGFPSNMFKSVKLYLNSTDCTGADSGCWPLRCHAASLLNTTPTGKKRDYVFAQHTMGKGGYVRDDTPEHEKIQELLLDRKETAEKEEDLIPAPENPALESAELKTLRESVNRLAIDMGMHGHTLKRHYSKSGCFVFARLPFDINSANLPIVSGVEITINMVKAPDPFYMFSLDSDAAEKAYRLQIIDAQLLTPVRRYQPGLQLDLEKRINKNNALHYFFPRIEIKKLTIAENQHTFGSESIKSLSQMPERCILLLMPEENWEGAYKTSPLESRAKYGESYAVTDITFSLNSQPLHPLGNLFTGEKCEQFLRAAYLQMQQTLVGCQRPYGVDLSFEEFCQGSFYFGADFTKPRRAYDSQVLHETTEGSLRLDIKFEKATKCVINVFILAIYGTRVTIHKNRRVTYNWVSMP